MPGLSRRSLTLFPEVGTAQSPLDQIVGVGLGQVVVVQAHTGQHVLTDGHGRERVRALEDHADVAAHGHRIHVLVVQVLAFEQHLALDVSAGDDLVHTVQGAQHGGLAAAGRADEGGDLVRLDVKLTDVSSIFENSGFKVFASAVSNGGVVKAINAKGFGSASVGQIDALTKTAVEAGAKGLAYIKVREEDWRSPISKFLSDEEKQKLTEALDIETGDLVLFAAGPWEPSCDILGRVRLQCAEFMELLKDNKERDFLWVIEFPLVGWDEEEQRWVAIHHPFTRPVKEDEQKLLSGELSADLRAQAYDVVLNGTELGGGSIRIHERDLQSAMFKALGITEEQAREQFGHILDAFSFGAPPHGGLALGLDRLVMMICNAESIREVIAFPKNNRGADLMSDSPAAAEDRQLRDIHIQVKLPAKK